MKHRWLIAESSPTEAARLAAKVDCSPLLAQCLINRGLGDSESAVRFLEPRLRHLEDPFELADMDRAVDRLWLARERQELVVVFGDYDVDGVTATALLLEVLRPLGWRLEAYLPHRLEEGYGLTLEAAANSHERFRASLVVAVDCGSTAHDTVTWLGTKGVDVIVLDHHQAVGPLPPAVAVVNPHLRGGKTCQSGELCSVGLAFKLVHAIVKRGRELSEPWAEAADVRASLDLVALGTIADLVPTVGENRILLKVGLERLNRLERPGLRSLRDVAQISGAIGTYEVGFQLGPRLNAAGRLETATDALDLLLTCEPSQAGLLANALDSRNRERQQIERGIDEEVTGVVRARFNPERDLVIAEGHSAWHVGVVGIVASRLQQEFHRPTIIFGSDGAEWRGSGRSIEGFDLAAALRSCDDLLLRHGGHAMAAGVRIRPENLPALRQRLNDLARQQIRPEQLQPSLRLEGEVPLSTFTLDQVEQLDRLQPCGPGNPLAQFVVRGVVLAGPPQPLGRDRQHLRLRVTDGALTLDALWWGWAGQPVPTDLFDLACVPQVNRYNQRRTVRLKLLDWRPEVEAASCGT